MKTMLKQAAMVAVLGLGAAQSASALEMVSNGGFETGNFTGWTVANPGNGGCGTNAWVVNGTGAHGCTNNVGDMPAPVAGTFAAYNTFDGPAGALMISQQIALPGSIAAATLSFLDTVRMNIGGLPRTLSIDLYDAADTVLLANLFSQNFQNVDQGWQLNSSNVTALLQAEAGQTVTLRISNIMPEDFTGPAGFGIDNVSLDVTAVPEPASLALFGLGVAGLGFARRRRAA